jgi:hypothetical protein
MQREHNQLIVSAMKAQPPEELTPSQQAHAQKMHQPTEPMITDMII